MRPISEIYESVMTYVNIKMLIRPDSGLSRATGLEGE